MTTQELLDKIDENRAAIRACRPLTEGEVRELDAYYRIGTTYSSNALEGNSLTLTETKVLLEDGLTVGGRPIRDYYEAVGHAKAYDFMLSLARGEGSRITEDAICRLHRLFYSGIDPDAAGRYREEQVFITGTDYLPPPPEDVPELMSGMVADVEARWASERPVVLAAFAHRRLVDIHPFLDGNGRTARLLMNLILVDRGYCVVTIPPILRHEYIAALQRAQRRGSPSDEAFVRLMAECELEAQRDYLRMFRIPAPGR